MGLFRLRTLFGNKLEPPDFLRKSPQMCGVAWAATLGRRQPEPRGPQRWGSASRVVAGLLPAWAGWGARAGGRRGPSSSSHPDGARRSKGDSALASGLGRAPRRAASVSSHPSAYRAARPRLPTAARGSAPRPPPGECWLRAGAKWRAELGPKGREPGGQPRPVPPAPQRRAPAAPDGQTDPGGPAGSRRRRRGGRGAARRGLIPAARAGGLAEQSEPGAPGRLQVPACVPTSRALGDFSVRPCNFAAASPASPGHGCETPEVHVCGDFAYCWALPVLRSPEPAVPGVLRIRLLRELGAAPTVPGSLGKPQGGHLGSALGRGVIWGEVADRPEWENPRAGERRHFAWGHPWGVSLAGKLFLLFLDRRRFPGESKRFPGRLLRLLPLPSFPSAEPWRGSRRPATVAGRSAPGALVLAQRCAQGPPAFGSVAWRHGVPWVGNFPLPGPSGWLPDLFRCMGRRVSETARQGPRRAGPAPFALQGSCASAQSPRSLLVSSVTGAPSAPLVCPACSWGDRAGILTGQPTAGVEDRRELRPPWGPGLKSRRDRGSRGAGGVAGLFLVLTHTHRERVELRGSPDSWILCFIAPSEVWGRPGKPEQKPLLSLCMRLLK